MNALIDAPTLKSMIRAVGAPRHRTHGEGGVGAEQVLLLDWVASSVDNQMVLEKVHVLAAPGGIVLALGIHVYHPQDPLPRHRRCIRAKEFPCLRL